MKLIALYLALALFPNLFTPVLTDGLLFDWTNALPWKRDMPKEDFKKHVALYLVKKDWMPKGPSLPEGDDIKPRYTGSVKEAYNMLTDENNMYESHERPLEKAVDLLREENGYKSDLESIFIIHTISGNARNYFVKNMMIVLAVRNFVKQYNVFTFNMPGLQASMEQTIVKSIFGQKANYEALGETIGDFFITAIQQGLLKPDQIHFFGFCYSSQLSSFIARYISSKNNNQKIKSISALDPYSAGMSGIRNKVVSKNDAQLVYAYHTNSIAYGSLYRKATADFNFNSGFSQPGCYTTRNILCSHRRAVTAFWYVILYPDMWQARKCPNWLLFKTCICNWNAKASLTFPPSASARGTYFLNTMSHKPYGYGTPGANCYTKYDEAMKPKTQSTSNQAGTTIDFEAVELL